VFVRFIPPIHYKIIQNIFRQIILQEICTNLTLNNIHFNCYYYSQTLDLNQNCKENYQYSQHLTLFLDPKTLFFNIKILHLTLLICVAGHSFFLV